MRSNLEELTEWGVGGRVLVLVEREVVRGRGCWPSVGVPCVRRI
jgi:hypothetical protein